ncbi:MAG: hypothetical protein WCP97_07335 [bacterium]
MKTWQKVAIGCCSCSLVIGVIAGGFAFWGGATLIDLAKKQEAVVAYAKTMLEKHNSVVDEIDHLSVISTTSTAQEFAQSNSSLQTKVTAFNSFLTSEAVPTGAEQISKEANTSAKLFNDIALLASEISKLRSENKDDAAQLVKINDKISEMNIQTAFLNKSLADAKVLETTATPDTPKKTTTKTANSSTPTTGGLKKN